jgi:multiple sugar transport system substrate-binding protein
VRAPLPAAPGMPSRSVFGGWDLMVARSSPRKAEAIAFIKFIQTEEVQRILYTSGGYIPVINEVFADPSHGPAYRDLPFYRRLLEHGFHRPAMEDYTKASDIVSHFLNRALRGELEPAAALARAQAMIRSGAPLIK